MQAIFKRIIVHLITLEARAVLHKYAPRIVAVTGSVGKTSTKDAVYAVLSRGTHVRKSEKSFNSEIGIPLTILGVPNAWNNPLRWLQNLFDGLILIVLPSPYPAWLVLEVGADRPGDISGLARWLPVDIAVITHVPEVPVHVEFFESPSALREEKASLIDALKVGGTLVTNGDDAHVVQFAQRAQAKGAAVVTYGLGTDAQVTATNIGILFEQETGGPGSPIGMQATLHLGGASAELHLPGAVGGYMLLPALAASAVGHVLGRSVPEILGGLGAFVPPPGRMHLLRGLKDTFIIDDTYNSSPTAAAGALETLALIAKHRGGRKHARRVAVLGDMMELGRHSVEEHRKVGTHAAKCVDLLLTVGFRSRDTAQGALDAGLPDSAILQYDNAQAAGSELQNLLQPGDVVLVKGSQSMRMEQAVEEIMLEPERARELLVRQEPEWKKR